MTIIRRLLFLLLWPAASGFLQDIKCLPSRTATSLNSHSKFDCEIPLVFVHGLKGSHLCKKEEQQRVWLHPSSLLNFPPKADGHPDRDLSLPLAYSKSDCGTIQDKGDLQVDGLVDHIIELKAEQFFQEQKLELIPFYGHVSQHLKELQERRVRPTRCFIYDWRRSLPELSREFHVFCEKEFPGRPVQIVAHSLGGLIAFDPIRKHPEKYAAGATLVGVPFGTGIQYFQDLHRGYFTEIGRNRQFTPPSQFTMSSHWAFFPLSQEEAGDTFVDVTNTRQPQLNFVPDQSAIGSPGTSFQSTVKGDNIAFDFYKVDEWETNQVGIFDPQYRNSIDKKTLEQYKQHMEVQLQQAKEWRMRALGPPQSNDEVSSMPDLVVCQTNTIPTLNQILRRKRSERQGGASAIQSEYEYDYVSGRSVPGDGRIDFDKSFPPSGFEYKQVPLDAKHAKQMCWEDSSGSLGTIVEEVTDQLQRYLESTSNNESPTATMAARNNEKSFQ